MTPTESPKEYEDQMKARLDNLTDLYMAGTPYQLDDEVRLFIANTMNIDLFRADQRSMSYAGINFPHIFTDQDYNRFPKGYEDPNAQEEIYLDTDGFENRNEDSVKFHIRNLQQIMRSLRVIKLIEALESGNFDGINDDWLLNLYLIHTKMPGYVNQAIERAPEWLGENVKHNLFDQITKEQQSFFKFSEKLKKKANEDAKAAKAQGRGPETHEVSENIPQ